MLDFILTLVNVISGAFVQEPQPTPQLPKPKPNQPTA
jgi:hypothetical protein